MFDDLEAKQDIFEYSTIKREKALNFEKKKFDF
jgi:hypothetical protein